MAIFNQHTITAKGAELMSAALASAKAIEFTGIEIGDGAAPANPETLTALVHKVMDVTISKAYKAESEPGTSIFRASFQNNTGSAFYFSEAGIFARLQGTNDTPILYGYTNAGDTADLIDTVEEGSLLMQTLLCNIVTGSAEVQLIDNPSALITRQDLTEYLPLTGGMMTGDILADKTALYIKHTKGNGEVSLLGGVSSVTGGGFYAYGGENESGAGWFRARAAKDGKYAELIGTPDGKLYWHGCDIITSAGGDINGELHHTKYGAPAIRYKDGGAIFFFPMGEEFYKGGFILRAYETSNNFKDLQGWSDGRLQWAGSDILTTSNGVAKTSSWGMPDYTKPVGLVVGTQTVAVDSIGYVRLVSRSYESLTVQVAGLIVYQTTQPATSGDMLYDSGYFLIPAGSTVRIIATNKLDGTEAGYYCPLLKS